MSEVLESLGSEPDPRGTVSQEFRDRVASIVSQGGGTLYIPPGRHVLDPTTAGILSGADDDWFLVPREVVLWFSPGAVLVVGAPSRRADLAPVELVLRGPIHCGLRQVFSTVGNGGTITGRVCFVGDRNPVVRPEWWGAGGLASSEDAIALSAATTAAFSRTWGGLSETPLPIELGTGYRLSRPLLISAKYPEDRGAVFVLRGRSAVAGTAQEATFTAEPDFRGEAVLIIRDRSAFVIENVSINGAGSAHRCVLEWVRARRSLPVADLFRNCEFWGATQALVETREVTPESKSKASIVLQGSVVFERCAFFRRGDGDFESTWGVDCATPTAAGTQFEHCVFDGAATAMIRARGGVISAAGCSFQNTGSDGPRGKGSGGVDILLDAVEPGMKISEVASCQLTACDSGSLHFLYAARGRSVRQSVLIGVTHRRTFDRFADSWSIYWEMLSETDLSDSTLFLSGCTMTEPVFWRMASGRILDIGNRLVHGGSFGAVLSSGFRVFPRPDGT